MRIESLVVHPKGKRAFDEQTGAVIPPINLSTTFAQSLPAKPIGVFKGNYHFHDIKNSCLGL